MNKEQKKKKYKIKRIVKISTFGVFIHLARGLYIYTQEAEEKKQAPPSGGN